MRPSSHLRPCSVSFRRWCLPVPTTSIYTRADGVVRWADCLNHDTETSENVEVYGRHCGLGFNLAALIVVADRLAQPLDRWQPFQVQRSLRGLFPAAPTFRVPAEHATG